MATVHVNNISDFISAVAVDGDTVILDTDLDFINNPITTSIVIGATTIVDGANHTLKNITSGINGVFRCKTNYSADIKNMNFYNVGFMGANDNNYFTYGATGFPGVRLRYTDCNFQGKFTRFAHDGTDFTRCIMSFNNSNNALIISDSTLDTCYIDFGIVVTNKTRIMTVKELLNTYIKGDITFLSSITTELITVTGGINTKWSVLNMDITGNGTAVKMMNTAHEGVLYNSDKIHNLTISSVPEIYGLTDAQLKDSTYIANNTTFPIAI